MQCGDRSVQDRSVLDSPKGKERKGKGKGREGKGKERRDETRRDERRLDWTRQDTRHKTQDSTFWCQFNEKYTYTCYIIGIIPGCLNSPKCSNTSDLQCHLTKRLEDVDLFA